MKVYYNEFDKRKAAMLRSLMDGGCINQGDIDDRPIQDVQPDDLRGYDRCHFFAGIGLWDYALDLAGWPANTPVWTGSCPCQPFSTAGSRKGKADDRHLWPEWLRLIKGCKPGTIFGEQVASAINMGANRENVFSLSDRESERYVQAVQGQVKRRATSFMQDMSKRVREEMAEYVKGIQEDAATKEAREGQDLSAELYIPKQGEIFGEPDTKKRKKEEPTFRPRCSCCGNTIKDRCWNMRGEQIPLGYWSKRGEGFQYAEYRPYRPKEGVCLREHKDSLFCNQCRLWRLGAEEYKESYEQLVRRFLSEQSGIADSVRYKPDEPVTQGWLDDVYEGLETEGYAVGAALLPASAIGAPHRRDRLWFVGNTEHNGRDTRQKSASNGATIQRSPQRPDSTCQPEGASGTVALADHHGARLQGHGRLKQINDSQGWQVKERQHWQGSVWIDCPDGKQRLVEPSIPLLVDGYPHRKPILHAIGDGIVPQVAAEFIKATME